MKVHASSKHPEFWRRRFRKPPAIFLDGRQLSRVIEADDAEGYVVVRGARLEDHFDQERLTGKVEFR